MNYSCNVSGQQNKCSLYNGFREPIVLIFIQDYHLTWLSTWPAPPSLSKIETKHMYFSQSLSRRYQLRHNVSPPPTCPFLSEGWGPGWEGNLYNTREMGAPRRPGPERTDGGGWWRMRRQILQIFFFFPLSVSNQSGQGPASGQTLDKIILKMFMRKCAIC